MISRHCILFFVFHLLAGRDDVNSYCLLFFGFSDVFRQSAMVFTEQTGLEKLYGMVAYSIDLGTYVFCDTLR